MDQNISALLNELSSRVNHAANAIAEQLQTRSSESNDSFETVKLPDEIRNSFNTILDLLENTATERKIVSDELFQTYTILNTTFDATLAVANCQTSRAALETLCAKISQVISPAYTYILGPLSSHFHLSPTILSANGPDTDDIQTANLTVTIDLRSLADDYVSRNINDISKMYHSNEDCLVRMIDYHGPANLDHDGRGNVLLIRLSGSHDELSNSALLFIRSDDQEPFVAVEMNLADSLGRMCSAVMGNIIYAEKLNQSFIQTISSLVRAMEAKDEYTCGHSNRVSDIACHLGRQLGLDPNQVNQLQWAGLLHDIGKIGIHEDILCKPGKLTDEEYMTIKSHPEKSFIVLEPVDALKNILPAVRHHHEHYDGSGYPDKLAGENIPFLARIIQVADVWDALTSTRSYRSAMPASRAIRILKEESGTTMDPAIVKQFLDILEDHPEWIPEESNPSGQSDSTKNE